jgi:cell division initiation protein
MSISPLDIAKHEFSKVMRGYDPAEVQAFLERLADEIEELQTQAATFSEQNRIYAAKLGAYQDMEKSLRDSLVAAQESQKSNRETLAHEREQILREARLDAEQLKLNTQRDIMTLQEDFRALKIHHDAYIKRLRFLMRAQSELIDLLEQQAPEMPDERNQKPAL